MPAALGAAGGLALDVGMGYLTNMAWYPNVLRSGAPASLAKIGGALGVGFLAKKFIRGSKGDAIAAGVLTITLYSILKPLLVQALPTLPGLGDYEEISIDTTSDQLGAYLPDGSSAAGMGAYLSGGPGDVYDVTDTAGAVLSGMEY